MVYCTLTWIITIQKKNIEKFEFWASYGLPLFWKFSKFCYQSGPWLKHFLLSQIVINDVLSHYPLWISPKCIKYTVLWKLGKFQGHPLVPIGSMLMILSMHYSVVQNSIFPGNSGTYNCAMKGKNPSQHDISWFGYVTNRGTHWYGCLSTITLLSKWHLKLKIWQQPKLRRI